MQKCSLFKVECNVKTLQIGKANFKQGRRYHALADRTMSVIQVRDGETVVSFPPERLSLYFKRV